MDGYGGVLIGIKSNVISDFIDSPSDLEVCTVLLHLSESVSLLLFCVYRSPNTDISYLTNMCDYIITVVSNYPDAIICCTGDFSLPDINWESEFIEGHRYPHAINEFVLDMSAQCGFTQMVNFPTRERNTLDLFFTTHPSYIQQHFLGLVTMT